MGVEKLDSGHSPRYEERCDLPWVYGRRPCGRLPILGMSNLRYHLWTVLHVKSVVGPLEMIPREPRRAWCGREAKKALDPGSGDGNGQRRLRQRVCGLSVVRNTDQYGEGLHDLTGAGEEELLFYPPCYVFL